MRDRSHRSPILQRGSDEEYYNQHLSATLTRVRNEGIRAGQLPVYLVAQDARRVLPL